MDSTPPFPRPPTGAMHNDNHNRHAPAGAARRGVFAGLVLYFSAEYSADEVDAVAGLVRREGGGIAADVNGAGSSTRCTHVVVHSQEHRDYQQAKHEGRAAVSMMWVTDSLKHGRLCELHSFVLYTPVANTLGIPGMKKLLLCGTGYAGVDRQQLRSLVEAAGATLSGDLTYGRTTHLLCRNAFEGLKYQKAVEWGVHVVSHKWLLDCICCWQRLNEDAYGPSSSGAERDCQASPAGKEQQKTVDLLGLQTEALILRSLTDSKQGPESLFHASWSPGSKSDVPETSWNTSLAASDTASCSDAAYAPKSGIATPYRQHQQHDECEDISSRFTHHRTHTNTTTSSTPSSSYTAEPKCEGADDRAQPSGCSPFRTPFRSSSFARRFNSPFRIQKLGAAREDDRESEACTPSTATTATRQLRSHASVAPGAEVWSEYDSRSPWAVVPLKKLSKAPRATTVKKCHGLTSLNGVLFAEQIRLLFPSGHGKEVVLNTKKKTQCVRIRADCIQHASTQRADSSSSFAEDKATAMVEPCSFYQLLAHDGEPGEWWMEFIHLYSMRELASLETAAGRRMVLPADFDSDRELLRAPSRREHCTLNAVVKECCVRRCGGGGGSKTPWKTPRAVAGRTDAFWRFNIDVDTLEFITDRTVKQFVFD
eukprot:jgi/Chlat1/8338/Chrsp8S08099